MPEADGAGTPDDARIKAVRWPPPEEVLLSACEVLAWITPGGVDMIEHEIRERWPTDQLEDLEVAIAARAAPAPYTPLERAFTKHWFMGCYIGRRCAHSLRMLRAHISRRAGGRLISFNELHELLARDRKKFQQAKEQRAQAHAALMAAVRAGELLGDAADVSKGLAPIDVSLFKRGMTIQGKTGWLTRGDVWGEDYAALLNVRTGPVWFRRDDVLRIWSARQSETTVPVLSGNTSHKKQRGRKPVYDWAPVERALGAKLAAEGLPELGDGGQAKLEAWVADQFEPEKCPSESTIRQRVSRAIEAHKKALSD